MNSPQHLQRHCLYKLGSTTEENFPLDNVGDLEFLFYSTTVLHRVGAISPPDDRQRFGELLQFSGKALVLAHVEVDLFHPRTLMTGLAITMTGEKWKFEMTNVS